MAFSNLPIEINQQIASHIEYDSHIGDFRLICEATRDAIDGDNHTFWRRRLLQVFDNPGWSQDENEKYMTAYQTRKRLLKNGTTFRTGGTAREKDCLALLRDLIVESFAAKSGSNPNKTGLTLESANLEHLKRFISSTNLLKIIFDPKAPSTSVSRTTSRTRTSSSFGLLQTIQVICAPALLSIDNDLAAHHFSFPVSQTAVYSTSTTTPMFGGRDGLEINMPFILHNVNFWRYHMTRKVEQTLFDAFSDLEDHERPQFWDRALQLATGSEKPMLGRRWKGSYAYIDRDVIEVARSGRCECEQVQDCFAGEDSAFAFQDMKLRVLEDGSHSWPEAFERHLCSLKVPTSQQHNDQPRAQKRAKTSNHEFIENFNSLSFAFDGQGKDVTESFHAAGWMNPLPPQSGIPGWNRMTMMKYFDNGDGTIDESALWAYEGVVLPGGKMVLGRWWSPGDGTGSSMYSGPFLLWCVDGAGEIDFDDEDEST